MKTNKILAVAALVMATVSFSASAVNERGHTGLGNAGQSARVGHESGQSAYEKSEAGKKHAAWAEGRKVTAKESIQCYNPALNRGSGVNTKC